jgi:hypothetical protein
MAENSIYNDSLADDRDKFIDDIFIRTTDVDLDNPDEILETPGLVINLDEVNNTSIARSTDIIEHLSGYYFDPKYVREHPYIKNKISQEMDNIRRLLKMLTINEKAQDTLIQSITCNFGKSALYSALTSLQSSTLSIQTQLEKSVSNIEEIFRKMQDECKETFDSKEKESLDDGSIVSRGSRDFLKELQAKIYGAPKQEFVDTETGEIKTNDVEGATPIEQIIGQL